MLPRRNQFFSSLFQKEENRRRFPFVYDPALQHYLKDIGRVPLLSAREESELAKRIERGDEGARLQLVEANLRIVVVIALPFRGRGLPLLDLIQAGNLGLMRAAEKFDRSRGYRFNTYAKFWVLQKIDRAVAEQGRAIRAPYNAVKVDEKIQHEIAAIEAEGGEPSYQEIARRLALSVEQVVEHMTMMQEPLSISRQAEDDESLIEVLEAPPLVLSSEARTTRLFADVIEKLKQALSEPERRVLELRFGLADGVSYDYKDISKIFKLTAERIKQIEASALAKMRDALGEDFLDNLP